MATAPSFKNFLRRSMDDVKKPEPLPEGTYRGTIKAHEYGESAKKKTAFVRFTLIPHEAESGVDADDLATALQGQPLTSKKQRADFYFTDESLYRFKDFCTSLGINHSGRSIEECVQECQGKEVLMDVTRTPSEDGESFYNNVAKVVGIEG